MDIDSIRIIINKDCNFDCSYCCNKFPELTDKIAKCKIDGIIQILKNDQCGQNTIKNILITGGEPFLDNDINYLYMSILLKNFKNHNFYFYSNGSKDENIIKFFNKMKEENCFDNIKGINISYHKKYHNEFVMINLNEINKLAPVTVRIEETLYRDHEIGRDLDNAVSIGMIRDIKTFKLNDCKRDNELIFEVY